MGLFKFQNYGAKGSLSDLISQNKDPKKVIDNPRVRATKETKNGYVFKVVDNLTIGSEVFKEAGVPLLDDTEAKTVELWVMCNVINKPETLNTEDYKVEIGEYIRAYNLNNQMGEPVEMSSDLCTTAFATVNVGDILVPVPSGTNEMLWKVSIDTGYGICLKVVKKTNFGEAGGYTCKIISN